MRARLSSKLLASAVGLTTSFQQEETKTINYNKKNKSLVSSLKPILILKETSSPATVPKKLVVLKCRKLVIM